MADYLPALVASLVLNAAQFRAGLAEAGSAAKAETTGMGTAINGLAAVGKVALLGVVAGAAAVGVASVHMAADFESATTRLITSAGETTQNIGMIRQGILDMAGQVGVSAQDLATAMYVVDSANIHGADSLVVLRAAAEGAKTENADLGVVANAVTSAMADYHLKASDAALVTTRLVTAVSMGKTTFQDLTGAMHSVLPIASAAHISMSDILGDLASMTEHGISADEATQNLSHTIQHLQTTTAPQNKELALLGVNARQLSDDLGTKGLSGTLQEVSDAIIQHMGPSGHVVLDMQTALRGLPPAVQQMGAAVINGSMSLGEFSKSAKGLNVEQAGLAHQFATLETSTHGIGSAQQSGAQITQSYAAALKAATGDSTTLNTALMLTGENATYTNQAVKAVGAATTEAGGHVAGWGAIQATFNQHLARLKDGLGAAGIALGTVLIPAVSRAIDVTMRLADWLGKNTQVSIPLAAAIGGVLLVAIGAYTISMAAAAIATIAATWPLLLIIVAVALVAAGIAILVMHWSQVSSAMAGPVRSALALLHPLFAAVGQAIQQAGRALAPLGAQFRQMGQELAPIGIVIGIVIGAILGLAAVILGALLAGAVRGLVAALTVLIPGAIHVAVVAIDLVVAVIKLAADLIGGVINVVADLLAGDWAGAWNDAGKLVQNVAGDIGRIVGDLFDLIGTIIHASLGGIVAFIGGFVQGAVGFFLWLYHALVGGSIIPDLVNQTVHWFEQLPGRILGVLSGLVAQVASVAGQIGSSILNGIIGALGNLGSAISSKVSGALSGISGSLHAAGIPGFAAGGLVTRRTLAWVGESGPELIVPLRDINQGGQAASYAPAASTSTPEGPSMDETNDLLNLLYQLLDERLPRQSARFSTRAYGPG